MQKFYDFGNSERLLEKALPIIPNGTQTFSKSRLQYVPGHFPLYAAKGNGAILFDEDGNEFIDFVSGLGTIILGYCDPDVDEAVEKQIKNGSIFTLPNKLEIEVAKLLYDMIPCAEMVRFGKNGSDVTSGAIRLARAITGRDHVLCSGYHGWQDWYVGITERHLGVPTRVSELTHPFEYGNIEEVERLFKLFRNQIACIIMEPFNRIIDKGFVQSVADLTKENGAIFIFDEMLTGFRVEYGGAQELLAIVPDLACFGKSMGNGYPISALVGKAKFMEKINGIHFSFTFGGDCISLAAAKATLIKLTEISVVDKIIEVGKQIVDYFYVPVYKSNSMPESREISMLSGHPTWSFLNFKTRNDFWKFKQETVKRGILINESHNLTYAHTQEHIDKLLKAYDEIIPNLDEIKLEFIPPQSLFRIR